MNRAAVHLAILRCAAFVVPEQQRAEWLAEWRAEVWGAEGLRIGTCLGGFKDAFWLRRYGPLPRAYGVLHLEAPAPPPEYIREHGASALTSPVRCLLFLGLLGAFTIVAARQTIMVDLPWIPGFLLGLIWAPLTSSFSLGHYPTGSSLRRWLFFAAKILLLAPVPLFAGAISPALGVFVFLGAIFAMRWVLEDQRRRCPTCLRLLDKPVRIGHASRTFLEWHGSEFVCLRGHGLLHVPEQPSIWFDQQRWMELDASWSGLFPR